MHRSHPSMLPSSSRLLQKRWDETNYGEHRRKVLSAKPVVDTSSPRTCGHLNTRSKKMQAQEERVAAIEHENRALLGRMAHIAGTGGRLDHRNSYVARSLNGEQRGRELERLARENQALLMRLQKSKPSYSAQQWEQQWLRSQQITSNISRFPRGGGGGGGGGGCAQSLAQAPR
uniref:Uncharacterized protein CFAP97D2-like n=1 Tax=Petromyzon marinus TaxID=7757 RepID=A0AAJ7XKA5_PETMA|nr:uncharacterized protein CFAP97D2-like [Petromyzon marinus]